MATSSVPRAEGTNEIAPVLSGFGMTLDDFIAEGHAGTLSHPELRDHWLTSADRLADLSLATQGDSLPACTRSEPRRHREMTVHYVSREELRDRIARDVSRVGMTLEEFIAEGKADALTDGNLRDLWLIYGDLISEE